MSDTPQGDGWWEASDGRWYPPEAVPGPDPDATQHWDRSSEPSGPGNYQAPGPSSFEPPSVQPSSGLPPGNFQPPAASPFEPPSAGPPPGYGAPPGGPPPGGYGAPPGGPPPGGYGVPPAGSPPGYGAPGPGGYGAPPKSGGGSRTVWIALAVIAGVLVIGCGGCVALVGIGANSATEGGFEFINELAIDFSNSVPATGPTSCEVTGIQSDGSDDYAVDALVTNESGVTSHYEINYELIGPDGESLGFDFGIVSNVEPGEMVRDFTVGIIDADPDWRDVSCVVTDARRVVAE